MVTSTQTSTAPWTPTAENLIFNTTVLQGMPSALGWLENGPLNGTIIFDGYARNVSIFFTPLGGTEKYTGG
jgi:hypothetical protein